MYAIFITLKTTLAFIIVDFVNWYTHTEHFLAIFYSKKNIDSCFAKYLSPELIFSSRLYLDLLFYLRRSSRRFTISLQYKDARLGTND